MIARTINYHGTPWKPSPAQRRILERFRTSRQLPAHADHWERHDMLPLQALIRRGILRVLIGPYENHYLLTHGGAKRTMPESR